MENDEKTNLKWIQDATTDLIVVLSDLVKSIRKNKTLTFEQANTMINLTNCISNLENSLTNFIDKGANKILLYKRKIER